MAAEEFTSGGEQIDTLVIANHLYLHGPGGTMFEISVGKDASGKDVVTATPDGNDDSLILVDREGLMT